jgi:hypothetical protein
MEIKKRRRKFSQNENREALPKAQHGKTQKKVRDQAVKEAQEEVQNPPPKLTFNRGRKPKKKAEEIVLKNEMTEEELTIGAAVLKQGKQRGHDVKEDHERMYQMEPHDLDRKIAQIEKDGKKMTVARRDWLAQLSPIFVGQVRLLWDMNLPTSEIAKRLKIMKQRISDIALIYDFPQRRNKPTHVVEPSEEDLDCLCEWYERGEKIKDIADKLGWPVHRVSRVAKAYGYRRFPNDPSNPQHEPPPQIIPEPKIHGVDPSQMTRRDIPPKLLSPDDAMETALDHLERNDYKNGKVSQYETYYKAENIKDLRSEEFTNQMIFTDGIRRLGVECLSVMGTTAAEIEAYDNIDELEKKSKMIKNITDMLSENNQYRSNQMEIRRQWQEKEDNDIFDIDFLGIAQNAGLRHTAGTAYADKPTPEQLQERYTEIDHLSNESLPDEF